MTPNPNTPGSTPPDPSPESPLGDDAPNAGGPIPVTVVCGDPDDIRSVIDTTQDAWPDVVAVGTPDVCGPTPTPTTAVTGVRTPGCRCCQTRLDIVDSIRLTVERRHPPQRLLLAVGSGDDVLVALRTILSDPDLTRVVDLDGVVAVINAAALSVRLATGAPLVSESVMDWLAVADRVHLTGIHTLTATAATNLPRLLRPWICVGDMVVTDSIKPHHADLCALGAWHGALPRRVPVGHPAGSGQGSPPAPRRLTFSVPGSVDPSRFDHWLSETHARYATNIARLQGALLLDGSDTRVCLRGVLSHAGVHSELTHTDGRRTPVSELSVVGWNLDRRNLQQGFAATAVEA